MVKGRPRSFDRDAALGQALLVFWRHGYDASSVSLLTRAMGISAPSMYAAFGDKRALFEEALLHYMRTHGAFMGRALQEPDAVKALEHMLFDAAATFTNHEHAPGCLVITAATNCAPESVDVQKRLQALRQSSLRAFEAKISACQASGQLRSHIEARELALFFMATLQGMSSQARDGASREDLEAIARSALRVLSQGA